MRFWGRRLGIEELGLKVRDLGGLYKVLQGNMGA